MGEMNSVLRQATEEQTIQLHSVEYLVTAGVSPTLLGQNLAALILLSSDRLEVRDQVFQWRRV